MGWKEALLWCSGLNPTDSTYWQLPNGNDYTFLADRAGFGAQLKVVDNSFYWTNYTYPNSASVKAINLGIATDTGFVMAPFDISTLNRVICAHGQ